MWPLLFLGKMQLISISLQSHWVDEKRILVAVHIFPLDISKSLTTAPNMPAGVFSCMAAMIKSESLRSRDAWSWLSSQHWREAAAHPSSSFPAISFLEASKISASNQMLPRGPGTSHTMLGTKSVQGS